MKPLELLDEIVASGQRTFDSAWVVQRTGRSPQAVSNMLRRMVEAGLVDRVSRGHYVVRPVGMLGTPAVSEDPVLVVAAIFGDIPHRTAYRTALDFWGLLTRPSRVIQVASPRRVRQTVSSYPLRVILESERTLEVGAVTVGNGVRISDKERALLDAASRMDVVGGISIVVEALSLAEPIDVEKMRSHSLLSSQAAALRRLGSLAEMMGLPDLAEASLPQARLDFDIDLDPTATSHVSRRAGYRDSKRRVRWGLEPDELLAVSGH